MIEEKSQKRHMMGLSPCKGHPVRVLHNAQMHQGQNGGKQIDRKLNEDMVEIYKFC